MNTATYLKIFLSAAALTCEDDDAILIGTLIPAYCPTGLDKVLLYHTTLTDLLLELPGISPLETVQLLARRGCTFHEYANIIFDTTISEKDFGKYNALRCLFLSSQKERREKVLYHFSRDSYEDYLRLLAQMLTFHPELFQFLFSDEN